MSDFRIHAEVNELISSFRSRGFTVSFTAGGQHQMLVRGPNNKGAYDSSLRFNSVTEASVWLQGYDYHLRKSTGDTHEPV
jgi:hypothetical protein